MSDLAGAVLTFAAIAFGACLTGAVLSLTIPSDEQRRALAAHKSTPDSRFTDFSDLVFTFTWSAVSQLPLAILAFSFYIIGGKVGTTNDLSHRIPERVALGLMAAALVYAFGQLTTVVKTISQLALVGPILERLDEAKALPPAGLADPH